MYVYMNDGMNEIRELVFLPDMGLSTDIA